MERRTFVFSVTLGFLGAPLATEAQQPATISRIGILSSSSTGSPEAFTQGLMDLAYVEGQNIVIERRNAKSYEQLPRLAAELVRLKVDVVFAPGSPAAQVARDSIQAIPVVFVTFADPVRTGLVATLARPGRNLTGLTMISAELAGKRLELLRKALPKVSHVAVLVNPANPSSGEQLLETQAAARSLGMRLEAHEVRTPHEFEAAFAAMRRAHADALFILPDTMFFSERKRIAGLAEKSRLPAMFHWRAYVDAGGLMAYGPSFADANRRAAVYVDKILKGAKPADLPVEQPTKYELIINLKTAKALGLTIPPALLQRADHVIE